MDLHLKSIKNFNHLLVVLLLSCCRLATIQGLTSAINEQGKTKQFTFASNNNGAQQQQQQQQSANDATGIVIKFNILFSNTKKKKKKKQKINRFVYLFKRKEITKFNRIGYRA